MQNSLVGMVFAFFYTNSNIKSSSLSIIPTVASESLWMNSWGFLFSQNLIIFSYLKSILTYHIVVFFVLRCWVYLPIFTDRRNDMFVYLLLAITLIYIAFLIYDIKLNDRSVWGKGINEDVPEDRNCLKSFHPHPDSRFFSGL